jgi:tripartite-type tricarboxylate transporter receptor subunit TctC
MTTLTLDRRAITLGLAGVLCMPAILRAQTSYPDRPINLIVPFAAGGPTDAIARIYAEFISRISARRW